MKNYRIFYFGDREYVLTGKELDEAYKLWDQNKIYFCERIGAGLGKPQGFELEELPVEERRILSANDYEPKK